MIDVVGTLRSYTLDRDNCPRMETELVHVRVGLLLAAADEITRLRAEVERWKNKAEAGEETAILQGGRLGILSVELDRLRAENEWLREALNKINVGEGWAAQIARAAIIGGKDE